MGGQIAFIIWRESVEALLVIGILQGWLRHGAGGAGGWRYLWGGVVAGLAGSLALAFGLARLAQTLGDEVHEQVLTAAVFVAAALIVQMVLWMRRNGPGLSQNLEARLDGAMQAGRLWGVFALALIAVAREGSETVVFLYGTLAAAGATSPLTLWGAIGLGIGAALASYALLHLGGRLLPWRLFFRASEAMLLALACALLVTGAGNLVGLGLLPYTDVLWNSGWLLDDRSPAGGIIAALTGYRAEPDLVTAAVWLGYAALLAWLLRPARAVAQGLR
jgi:high-affinity iron transporter